MNLIIHYLTLLENNYNEPDNIYAKNFTLFFTKLKNFLNYKTRNGDTFLHIFTKNSKKSFVISTLTHLIKEEIITQELLSEKNNEDIIMISYIIEYIKKNYMSIINNELLYQSYIEFFDLLKEKFPTFCEKCIKKEEYLEIVRLENKITFDKDNLNYNVTVEYEIEKLTINATPEDSKAKVVYQKENILKVGENKITITVEAKNKSTKNYTITVTRKEEGKKLSNVSSLSSLYIDGNRNGRTGHDLAQCNYPKETKIIPPIGGIFYTLRTFFGRQPLCGMRVVSVMDCTTRPAFANPRTADSRP